MNRFEIKPFLFSLVFSIAAAFLLILLSALLILKSENPEKFIAALCPAAVFTGSLAGGIVCAKKSTVRGSVAGIINGIIFAVFILLAGVFVDGGGFSWLRIIYIAAIILVSSVGGRLAGKSRSVPKKAKKLSKNLLKR